MIMMLKFFKFFVCVFVLSFVGCGGGEVFIVFVSSEFVYGNELLSVLVLIEDVSYVLVVI